MRGIYLLATCLLATYADLAYAQVTASLSGRIEDAAGAAIPGTVVTVTNLETKATRVLMAEETGEYRVLSLPVGPYAIRAEKSGFKVSIQTGINLVVGQDAVVNLILQIGEVQQEVTVQAEAPLINTTTASVSGLVGEKEVKELPLNGRSFDNLIALNAGAINFSQHQPGGPGGAVGNFFSVSGRRPSENLFLLNGVEYTGPNQGVSLPGGVSGQMLGIDAVREFNVVSDAYSAEYGKRAGAQVSIVTQSGTNQLHGTLFEFLRNSDLDARNFFDQGGIPPFRRNQFGGAAGGPILKDRMFVFGNYEGFRQRLGISDVTIVPDANARQGLLPNAQGVPTPVPGLNPDMLRYMALWPTPNGPDLGKGYAKAYSNPKQSIREDFGTLRLDQNFSVKDALAATYTVDDGDNLTPNPDPVFGTIYQLRNQVASVQETHLFSPAVINVFTAGFSRAGFFLDSPPLVPLPPGLSFVAGRPPGNLTIGGAVGGGGVISSITPAGGSTALVYTNNKSLFTYADQIQVIRGRHQISAGVRFERMRSNEFGTPRMYGQAVFASLQTFLQGTVSSFGVVPNPTEHAWRQFKGSWYLQDVMQLRPNLSVRLGLRHEFTNGWNDADGRSSNYVYDANGVLQTKPMVGDSALTQNNSKRLFGPRVGLAWDPFGKGKTSLRAAFGTYYDIQDFLGFILSAVPPFNGSISFQNVPLGPLLPVVPTTPAPPDCGPGVPKPCTIYAPQGVQPDFKTPTIEEWNFAVEQQITPNTSVRLAYVGSEGFHQMVTLDPNTIHPQTCTSAAGCVSGGVNATTGFVPQGTSYIPVGSRPNPYLANGYFWFSEGNSNYNALQVDVTKRLTRGLQLRGNYTWSKSLDTLSGQLSGNALNEPQSVMNPFNMRQNWGPAAHDITHKASLSGSYALPFGQTTKGAGGRLAGGWQLNWIVTLMSGYPLTPLAGTNISGDGNARQPDRPSWSPGFTGPVITGTPDQWFNPQAFILPVSGTYGDVGRGVLRGPGLADLDLSLFKNIALSERKNLQFRAESFNLVNRANFSTPNDIVFANGTASPSAGLITSTATSSRQIQLSLKLIF